jgi:hypothetical protein
MEEEKVFGTCLLETSVVDAHLKLLFGLGDDNRVSQPATGGGPPG